MILESKVDLGTFNTLALPGQAACYLKISEPGQLTEAKLGQARRFILSGEYKF